MYVLDQSRTLKFAMNTEDTVLKSKFNLCSKIKPGNVELKRPSSLPIVWQEFYYHCLYPPVLPVCLHTHVLPPPSHLHPLLDLWCEHAGGCQ